MCAYIADFGLTTIFPDQANLTASYIEGCTVRWSSPELLDPGQLGMKDSHPTAKSDCYALAMVVYEVLSGQVPFGRCKNTVVIGKIMDGERPGKPEGTQAEFFTDALWETLQLCWRHQPQDRPSVKTLLRCLEGVAQLSRAPSPAPTANEEVGAGADDTLGFMLSSSGTVPYSIRTHGANVQSSSLGDGSADKTR